MRVLELFAGVGGFSLGLERTGGFSTVAFCEADPYARAVLKKHWPGVPCYEDVCALTADTLDRDGIAVDVLTGGFPCQDLSASGSGDGLDGERSGLWREFFRLIGELRPSFVLVENSPNLVRGRNGHWAKRFFGDLASIGYDAQWDVIPLSDSGAPHKRERTIVVAYPTRIGQPRPGKYLQPLNSAPDRYREASWLVDAFRQGSLPFVCRGHDGVSQGMEQLTRYGNAIGPAISEMIGHAILAAEAA